MTTTETIPEIDDTDTTIEQDAALLTAIIEDNPSIGIVMANAVIGFRHALAAASEQLEIDPDDPMAIAVFSIGCNLGLVDKSEKSDDENIVLVGSDDLHDAIEILRLTFGSEDDEAPAPEVVQ